MIDVEVTSDLIRAMDSANSEVSIGTPDWSSGEVGPSVPRPTDATVAGEAERLRFGPAFVRVTALDGEATHELGSETGPLDLPADSYLVDIATTVKTYLRFDGPATIRKSPDYQQLTVEFPERTPVTLGFRSRHEYPVGELAVPPTVDGLATALSHLHVSIKTTNADKSYPTLRGHPPEIELSDAVSVPDDVRDNTADTGIELRVPESLESLFLLAPLAYYLQANVVAEPRERPVLCANGTRRELRSAPDLQYDAAALLRQVFFLDCLVRNVGPHGTDLAETALLDELHFDDEWAYDADPADRLAAYLEVPYRAIEPTLPDWHLSMYVAPEPGRVTSIPYLLDRLSLVYLPRTSTLASSELIDRSLDDFFRGATDGRTTGPVASIDPVKPELEAGRVHGWHADGVPIDVFKAREAAFRNRFQYLDLDTDHVNVTVVLNDDEMDGEHDEAAAIYRRAAEDLPLGVDVREHLTRDELAAVFESENSFVHYIGHCEMEGLRCTDGALSVATIDRSMTETFFLNACGSYHEGMALLEKGSVAGAVTFNKVLNKQAAKVGTTFARLITTAGFSIERAMKLARRRIMMGKDYAVIGDGTHQLTQCENLYPSMPRVTTADDDEYVFETVLFTAWTTGGYYQTLLEKVDETRLSGSTTRMTISRSELEGLLDRSESPFLFDGEFHWPEEILQRLDGDR